MKRNGSPAPRPLAVGLACVAPLALICIAAAAQPDPGQKNPTAAEQLRLWSGAYPRSPALVKKLLARGLDPNRPDWLGKTFLHACAENGALSRAERSIT